MTNFSFDFYYNVVKVRDKLVIIHSVLFAITYYLSTHCFLFNPLIIINFSSGQIRCYPYETSIVIMGL